VKYLRVAYCRLDLYLECWEGLLFALASLVVILPMDWIASLVVILPMDWTVVYYSIVAGAAIPLLLETDGCCAVMYVCCIDRNVLDTEDIIVITS
jgi:hypothetical protein